VFVRQALSRLSYSPASSGTRIEPRSPPSERGVLPLRQSLNGASPSISGSEIDATAAPLSRSAQAERRCPSHSPTLRPWIAVHRMHMSKRTSSYVEGPWSPTSDARLPNWHAKARHKSLALFSTPQRAEDFLSQAGPRFDLELVQAEHHPSVSISSIRLRNDEGDPLGRPRVELYAANLLAYQPLSESSHVAGLARFVPARQRRRGFDRIGKERTGVDYHQHRLVSMPQRRIAQTSNVRKRSEGISPSGSLVLTAKHDGNYEASISEAGGTGSTTRAR
jgi:hypothetical protein